MEKEYPVNISILNREDLVCHSDIITKPLIRLKCDCQYKATCGQIVDLLENEKLKEAENIIKNILQ